MTTCAALLRGVNVGRAKRVPMADLRALLEGLGCEGVSTLLNSGNAVFRAARATPAQLATRIAAAIEAEMGFEVPVIVKSASDLAAIEAENVLADGAADLTRLLVAFVQDPKELAGLAAVESFVEAPERFLIGRQAAFLDCARGILESRAAVALLERTGKGAATVTTRNWATVLKILDRVRATDAGS